jgi:hypothetical protein
MAGKNRRSLDERVAEAAEAALDDQKYVSPIDVMLRIGWVDGGTVKLWRRGQIDVLERAVQVDASRISEAIALLSSWAAGKGLVAHETAYVAGTPQRQTLRFSESGEEAIEQLYRTHWLAADISERTRERLAEKASRPPDLLVIQPLNDEWTCHRCGGTGSLLVMENPGPACLRCVGLGDLEFLGAGNTLLTRRARAKSPRHAVVVRFSKARRRYERQGLMVEPTALAEAERELAAEKR